MSKKWIKIWLIITAILIFFNQRRYYIKCFLGNNQDGVHILAYHHVVSDEEKIQYWKNNLDVMSVSQFESHMRYLYEEGYTTLTLDQLYDWKHGTLVIPEKSVVITFDDGYTSLIYTIQPILEKYHFCASCFIIGSYTRDLTAAYENGRLHYVGLDVLKSDNQVFSFYSHGYELHDLTANHERKIEIMSKEELKQDVLNQSKITSVDYLAYPWGKSNRKINDVLKESGMKMAFTYANFSPVTKKSDDESIPRWAMFSYLSVKDVADILKR